MPIKASTLVHCAFVLLFFIVNANVASALEPEKSSLITKVTIDAPYHFQINENKIYIGAKACRKLIDEKSKVKVTYESNLNLTNTPKLVDKVVTFEVARRSTARIDCSDASSLCSPVNNEWVKIEGKKVTVDLPFSELVGFSQSSECEAIDKEFFVRLLIRKNLTDTTYVASDAKFVVDSYGPAAPVLDSANATDSTITVALQPLNDPDVNTYALVYSQGTLTAGSVPNPEDSQATVTYFGTKDTKQSTIKVTLEAGKEYNVAVAGRDLTGNLGTLSNVIQVVPVSTIDFWEAYVKAGGKAEGCSTSPGQSPTGAIPFLLLASLGLFVHNRQKKMKPHLKHPK